MYVTVFPCTHQLLSSFNSFLLSHNPLYSILFFSSYLNKIHLIHYIMSFIILICWFLLFSSYSIAFCQSVVFPVHISATLSHCFFLSNMYSCNCEKWQWSSYLNKIKPYSIILFLPSLYSMQIYHFLLSLTLIYCMLLYFLLLCNYFHRLIMSFLIIIHCIQFFSSLLTWIRYILSITSCLLFR